MSELPEGWVETTLGEVAKVKGGKRIPKGKDLVLHKTNHPYIRITDLENHSIKTNQLQFVTEEVFSSISRYIVNSKDVILSIVGTIGLVAKINNSLNNANLTENCVKLTTDNNIDSDFLFYFLISRIGQYEINRNTVGAVQKKLPIYGVKNIEISLPRPPEQRAIAKVLSAFDEKIELLREQNETLETIAQTIFKEWFVNFNYPGATGEMIDSELGEIPKGWRVGNIGDVLELLYGKPLKTEDRDGSGFPVYGSNGVIGYHEKYLVEAPGIIVGRKGSMGEVVWSNKNFYPIDTAFYVSDILDTTGLFFHYFLLKRYDFEKIGSDSAVPGLNRNAVYLIEVVIPSLDVIEQFNTVCETIFEKIKNNTAQIQTLSKTRDTLLPKLMSGEVRTAGFEQ